VKEREEEDFLVARREGVRSRRWTWDGCSVVAVRVVRNKIKSVPTKGQEAMSK